MQTGDFNSDGLPDALLVGNSYASETYTGWYDAVRGCLLLGNGRGGFWAVPPTEAGLSVDGDAKALAALSAGNELWYLTTTKNGPVRVLSPTKPQKPNRVKPRKMAWMVSIPTAGASALKCTTGRAI